LTNDETQDTEGRPAAATSVVLRGLLVLVTRDSSTASTGGARATRAPAAAVR
jgi:hypothetical protein